MKRLDLIIDALVYAKSESLSYEVWDRVDEALAAARELRELKPVAWEYKNIKPGWKSTKFLELQAEPPDGGWKDYKETPLYALGDEK